MEIELEQDDSEEHTDDTLTQETAPESEPANASEFRVDTPSTSNTIYSLPESLVFSDTPYRKRRKTRESVADTTWKKIMRKGCS